MIDNTMPNRITVRHNTRIGRLSIAEEKAGILLPEDILEAEYIRADLAAGDANEPLAEYQFRWVMIDGEWEPVQVHIPKIKGCSTVLFLRIGDDGSISRDMESVDAVGPVIRQPEDF